MSALHELQQAFAASMLLEDGVVFGRIIEDGFTAAERLRIYRNTFRSTLIEALRITYPAVDRLVGRDFFDVAAEQFIHAHPPSSAYLNEYGGGFADFLASFQPASTLPYLPDVARFEWALSVAASAVDASMLEPGVLAAVDPASHAALQFEPHPSVRLLALDYPADEIADAVMSGDDAAIAEVDVSRHPVWLIVHLGLKVEGNKLHFAPCLPASWTKFKLHYRYRETVYHISVVPAAAGETRATVDGFERNDQAIPLVHDRREHVVAVCVRRAH